MFTVHEGEIIYKEKYGTYFRQRFYVKPPEQPNVVIIDDEKTSEFTNLFTRIFLPQGYPNSVSKDYTNYQIWDTAQAFCSTITGILSTQEVLRGVGVGDNSATPLAATITWVLKDGCGHLGKIFFAYTRGSHLDAYSKKWRIYADTLNDAAMGLELSLPAFKSYTTFVLCISTVMKAIVGVAGGATRAAMTQHQAIRENLADVTAKDSAQETAVNLIASITALMIITIFGNSFTIFIMMIILHIFFNYLAVRSVCLKTLNEPRFSQIIDLYLRKEIIASPCEINRNEPIIFYNAMGWDNLGKILCGFKVQIGHSMKNLVKKNPKAFYMKNVQEVYKNNHYIILHSIKNRKIHVFLRDVSTADDILCSYFHAVLYGIVICAINDYPLPIYKSHENVSKPFPQICQSLQQAEWSRDTMENPYGKFTYEPSIALMDFLNRTVTKEWPKITSVMEQVGWDLKKHLLLVEEWRICTAKLVARHVSIGEQVIPEVLAHAASRMITFDEKHEGTVEEPAIKDYTIEPEKMDDQDSANQSNHNHETKQETPACPTIIDRKIDSKTTKKD